MNTALDNLRVASPCSMSWDAMTGDARVKFCSHCRQHVYFLSEMKRDEAEALLRAKEGQLCVRYYRRADGGVMTLDCPGAMGPHQKKPAKSTGT